MLVIVAAHSNIKALSELMLRRMCLALYCCRAGWGDSEMTCVAISRANP